MGGVLGLLVAWIMLYVGREWIFMLFDYWPMDIPEGANLYVSSEMLFAPVVFLIAFIVSGAKFALRFVAGMDVVAQADCVFIV